MLINVSVAYPLIIIAALTLGAWLLTRTQRSLGLSNREKFTVGLGAFCGGMIGAKLPFAIADLPGLIDGSVWLADGKTIMTGLVGAYFGVEFAKWAGQIKTRTGDSFVVPAAIAISVGRLGCFVGGCCFGTATQLPWGVAFSESADPLLLRHPTQLYEAIFHAAMALLLLELRRRGVWRGQLAKFYLLSYFAYRFITEAIRPEPRFFAGFTSYQWFALGIAPVFIWLWWRDSRRMRIESECPAESQP